MILLLISADIPLAAQQHSVNGSGQQQQLAMKLKNPVSDLTLIPLQNNLEFSTGLSNATRNTLKIEPVMPVSLSQNWRIITRTIFPVAFQDRSLGDKDGTTGIGDVNFSFFFSPNYKINGWIWGIGPVLNFPTASNELFGYRKWAAGPTAVVVKQTGGLTYGLLLNQQWSFGAPGSQTVNGMLIDPWSSYTWKSGLSLDIEAESSVDWISGDCSIPLRGGIGQLFYFGPFPIGLTIDGLWYIARATHDPHWGVSVTLNFVIIK